MGRFGKVGLVHGRTRSFTYVGLVVFGWFVSVLAYQSTDHPRIEKTSSPLVFTEYNYVVPMVIREGTQ